jgi:hypothetical protein
VEWSAGMGRALLGRGRGVWWGVRMGRREGAGLGRPRGGGGFVGRASALGWEKGAQVSLFFPIFFLS